MTQRVISAFVMWETDPKQAPLRRGIGAIFGGVMVAVIVAAVFGIYGILTKTGTNTWQTDGSVVVEKETGASFVYFAGELHPTLNIASAMLAGGRPNPVIRRVSSKSLSVVSRGITIGIPGAPNSMPRARDRVTLPWTLCAAPGSGAAGRPLRTVLLTVGTAPSGRRLGIGDGLLVRDSATDTTYLIWNGHRYQVNLPATVVPALFGAVDPVASGTAWLNALPAGIDIGPIQIAGRGNPSPTVQGRRLGDILVADTGSGPQHYVVLDDGLAAITPLQEAILRAQSAAQPDRIAINEATAAPQSRKLSLPTGQTAPPSNPPTLAAPTGTDLVCAVTANALAVPEIAIGGTIDGLASANPTGSAGIDGTTLADRIHVPSGRVAIVRVVGASGAGAGSYTLVTDVGIQYPLASPNVLLLLGYAANFAVDVPYSLVNKIPVGPTLDPAAALQPARITNIIPSGSPSGPSQR
jgi:type VII secretion protein EccB